MFQPEDAESLGSLSEAGLRITCLRHLTTPFGWVTWFYFAAGTTGRTENPKLRLKSLQATPSESKSKLYALFE